MKRLGVLCLSVGLFSCGENVRPPVPVATPEQVRTLYGLNPGSCYTYRYPPNSQATISVVGPNTMSIIGKTVYVWGRVGAGGGQPEEWFLDTESDSEIRMIRSTEGVGRNRIFYRYDAVAHPVFLRVSLDRDGQAVLEDNARFETEVMPEVCPVDPSMDCRPGDAERHTWTVLANRKMVMTTDGEQEATVLEYRHSVKGTARYELVPGYGFAAFTDFNGNVHQICQARICAADGTCTGAADCSAPCN